MLWRMSQAASVDELAQFARRSSAKHFPVFLLMQFALFFEIRKRFEAADATLDYTGGLFTGGEIVHK